MQHLNVLEECGLVLGRKEGRVRLNYVNPIPIREVVGRWLDDRSEAAAQTALRLKRYAENQTEKRPLMDQNPTQSGYRLLKIEMEMTIAAPRDRVFNAVVQEVGEWWPHRYKPDSEVYCENRVGGHIGERFKNGGGALYGVIAYLDPPSKIVTTGPSSLLKGYDSYSVESIEEVDAGTLYKKSMTLWGDVPPELEAMFTQGMRAILESALTNYVVNGVRYQVPKENS